MPWLKARLTAPLCAPLSSVGAFAVYMGCLCRVPSSDFCPHLFIASFVRLTSAFLFFGQSACLRNLSVWQPVLCEIPLQGEVGLCRSIWLFQAFIQPKPISLASWRTKNGALSNPVDSVSWRLNFCCRLIIYRKSDGKMPVSRSEKVRIDKIIRMRLLYCLRIYRLRNFSAWQLALQFYYWWFMR